MSVRKRVPKKIRFEVFKRDKFTCQYCGQKAPDVVLHCDHITPVFEGGKNDILNLITSCVDCNLGKGKTELSDDSAVVKQREQIEALAERREQIDMLLSWRNTLSENAEYEIDQIISFWESLFGGFSLSSSGRDAVRKYLKRYGFNEVIEAIDIARDTYGFDPENGMQSAGFAFLKIGGILANRRMYEDRPYMRDVHYACGILRKRLSYFNRGQAIAILTELAEYGYPGEELKDMATRVRNWTQFKNTAAHMLDEEDVD